MGMLGLLGCGFAFLMGWHLFCAWMHNSLTGFLCYLGSRFAVWMFYLLYFLAAASDEIKEKGMYWHIHHYLIAWMCAIFAEFNHPISLLLLAVASGIFVQGIAAYDFDPLVYYKHE